MTNPENSPGRADARPPIDNGREEIQGAAILAAGTLFSRLMGFVRDLLIAFLLGPGADAFLVAFRLPNFVRRLLAEGSLGLACGAGAGAVLVEKGPAEARRIAGTSAVVLFLAALAFSLLLALLARPLVFCLAPGLPDAQLAQSAHLLRMCLPYVPLCVFSAIAYSHACAEGNFLPQAWSPALWNAVIVLAGGMFLLAGSILPGFSSPELVLCAGVVVGGLVQAAVALRCFFPGSAPFLPHARALPSQKKKTDPPLRPKEPDEAGTHGPISGRLQGLVQALFSHTTAHFLRHFPSTLLGSAPHQLHILAGMLLASFLAPGSISSLYFAERLVEFPLGMAGATLGMAALPKLSELAAKGNGQGFTEVMRLSIRRTAFLSLPSAAGLFALAGPLTGALFGHGAFHAGAVETSAGALKAYSLAVPALCAARPLLSALHALGRGENAGRCALLSLTPVVLFALAGRLLSGYGNASAVSPLVFLALGIAAGAWLNAWLLVRELRKTGIRAVSSKDRGVFIRYGAGACVLGCVLALLRDLWVAPGLGGTLVLVAVGTTLWLTAFRIAGSDEARDVLGIFR